MITKINKPACEVQPGDTVLYIPKSPAQGTVTAVCRFAVPIANKSPRHWQPGGRQEIRRTDEPTSKTLKLPSPPSSKTAKAIAREIEGCYNEGEIESVTLRIGQRNFSLSPDTPVCVWIPATNLPWSA